MIFFILVYCLTFLSPAVYIISNCVTNREVMLPDSPWRVKVARVRLFVTQFIMCYVIRRILTLNLMFKVKFNDGEHTCLFSELKSDVEACQLALALHQSSTIEHIILVVDTDDLEIVSLKNFK